MRFRSMDAGTDMNVTIYHNPSCGTSRKVLGMLHENGVEPQVIEYLKTPPDRATLARLVAEMRVPVRSILRRKAPPYAELQLDDAKWSDEQLLDLMTANPILIERPIVVTPKGTRLCRPPETVLELIG
jgi:arsenate reductase